MQRSTIQTIEMRTHAPNGPRVTFMLTSHLVPVQPTCCTRRCYQISALARELTNSTAHCRSIRRGYSATFPEVIHQHYRGFFCCVLSRSSGQCTGKTAEIKSATTDAECRLPVLPPGVAIHSAVLHVTRPSARVRASTSMMRSRSASVHLPDCSCNLPFILHQKTSATKGNGGRGGGNEEKVAV